MVQRRFERWKKRRPRDGGSVGLGMVEGRLRDGRR